MTAMRFITALLIPAMALAAPAVSSGSSTTTTVTRTSVVYTTATTYTTTTSTIGTVSTVTTTTSTTTFTPIQTGTAYSTTTVTRPCNGAKQQVAVSKRNKDVGQVTALEPERVAETALHPRAYIETCTATVTVRSTATATVTSQSSTFTTVATATSTSTVTSTVSLASTTTTTLVSTVTAEPTNCPAPTLCSNQGLEFGVYPNTITNNDKTYSTFLPEIYKTMTPSCSDVINYVGGFGYNYDSSHTTFNIYGKCSRNADYWAANHRAYIFAPQTGVYNFAVDSVDDIAEVWVGSKAYAGWNRSNSDIDCVVRNDNKCTYQMNLTAGTYYPLRIMYANAQTNAAFYLTVTNPDGSVFLNKDSTGSPYLVRYSCDQTTAPPFSKWGSE